MSYVVEGRLVIECPAHEGAHDCNSFCPNCEGEQEVEVADIWDALENPPAGCDAVAELYSWGYNEGAQKTFSVFLDLTGISSEMGAWYLSEVKPLGFIELDKLARALAEYTDRPVDVKRYVDVLVRMEMGK